MVLERYLSRFLEAYIGRYVKGLDSENVRLSVSRGEVSDRTVPLPAGHGSCSQLFYQ